MSSLSLLSITGFLRVLRFPPVVTLVPMRGDLYWTSRENSSGSWIIGLSNINKGSLQPSSAQRCKRKLVFLSSGECDFENGLCTWTNMLVGDKFDWLRTRGHTSSLNTGPKTDHTKQDYSGTLIYSQVVGVVNLT